MNQDRNHNRVLDAIWGLDLDTLYCAQCRSVHLVSGGLAPEVCPVCFSSVTSVEAGNQSSGLRHEPPELIIPFQIDAQRARQALAGWLQASWLRPNEFNPELLSKRLRRYFLPLWLIDADVEAVWQAEMGYHYQAASFREHYQGGSWVSQQVEETRTRWEKRIGTLKRHYDNVAVPALEKHERWVSRLGGYDYRAYQPYSTSSIDASIIRVPDYAPDAAWMDAENAIDQIAARECMQAAGADQIRNWSMNATYTHLNWTQMLIPAYVTWYREGERYYPLWINGQNGHIDGVKLMSMSKAWLLAAAIGALAVLCFLLGAVLSIIGIGILLILLSMPLGLLAFLPPIWAWQHNTHARRQAWSP